jgi:transcriptional regulator with GAF, ATPase, and Fis domain
MADPVTSLEVYPTCTVVSALPEEGVNLRDEMQRYQEWLVQQALIRTNGNRAQAARLLGLKRTTLVMMLRAKVRPTMSARKLPA